MPINYDEVDSLAEMKYDTGYDNKEDKVFALLVDVADRYVSLLEEQASDQPAPYLGIATPMEAALNGLKENLDMKREGTSPQHR